jgi:hypothetical protein
MVARPRSASATPPVRVRALPPRDSRGRFVAFPTTQAPSWYVLCVGGDRIAPAPPAAIAVAGTPVLVRPPALARSRRHTRLTRLLAHSGLHSAAWVVLVIVVSAWYRLQLPVPGR